MLTLERMNKILHCVHLKLRMREAHWLSIMPTSCWLLHADRLVARFPGCKVGLGRYRKSVLEPVFALPHYCITSGYQ